MSSSSKILFSFLVIFITKSFNFCIVIVGSQVENCCCSVGETEDFTTGVVLVVVFGMEYGMFALIGWLCVVL